MVAAQLRNFHRPARIELKAFATPLERTLMSEGLVNIAGVDEAGRGPLAGPVVAAAVLYREHELLWRCRDSKVLTASMRAELHAKIIATFDVGIGQCSPEEIERMNILAASLEAMRRAIANLRVVPELVLVDGNRSPVGPWRAQAIVQGDARVHTIGAASIVAKVERDRIMTEAAQRYPEYGFEQHFGYPTARHRELIARFGPCAIHRKTFRGVREFV
jgi:ribonuclease HII